MRVAYPLLLGSLLVWVAGCHVAEPSSAKANSASQTDAKQTITSRTTTIPSGPTEKRRWCVTGYVRDARGTPLADVVVTANCGVGSLLPTGRTVTDKEGRYELWFGQGMFMLSEGSGLQAATIFPSKPGWFEQNLHRQGDLRMANYLPDENEMGGWAIGHVVVLPHQPHRLDFVMQPAVTVSGRLLNSAREPIPHHKISVDADELPPSSSVLAQVETDAEGRFVIENLPTRAFWLEFASPNDSTQTLLTPKMRATRGKPLSIEVVHQPQQIPPVMVRAVSAD